MSSGRWGAAQVRPRSRKARAQAHTRRTTRGGFHKFKAQWSPRSVSSACGNGERRDPLGSGPQSHRCGTAARGPASTALRRLGRLQRSGRSARLSSRQASRTAVRATAVAGAEATEPDRRAGTAAGAKLGGTMTARRAPRPRLLPTSPSQQTRISPRGRHTREVREHRQRDQRSTPMAPARGMKLEPARWHGLRLTSYSGPAAFGTALPSRPPPAWSADLISPGSPRIISTAATANSTAFSAAPTNAGVRMFAGPCRRDATSATTEITRPAEVEQQEGAPPSPPATLLASPGLGVCRARRAGPVGDERFRPG